MKMKTSALIDTTISNPLHQIKAKSLLEFVPVLLKKCIHIFLTAISANNSQMFYSATGNEKNVTPS